MITILQGKKEGLQLYASKKYTADHHHVVNGTKDFAVPFLIFRNLIPFLRNYIANDKIDELLFSNRIYISPIYEYLNSYLNDNEIKRKHLSTARLDSNITHSTVAKLDIIRSCAAILIDLHKQFKFSLIIPNLSYVDVNSLDLLKFIYQVYPKQAPNLVLGYDPNWEDDQYDKSTGISRYYNFDTITFLQSFVYAFEGISSVNEKVHIHDHSTHTTPSNFFERNRAIDAYDDDSEWKAHKMLNNADIFPDHHQSHYIVGAIKKCFRLFDFTNAMVLSQKAQKKLDSFLTNEEKAILLHIEGLCAHNRHFFTQGNMPLANHLHQTFEKALTYEVNPSRRIALLYRLIVTTSRRKNDFKAANLYAMQAFEELKTFSGENKELLLAWINNVYSYMLMKEGDSTGAIQKHEEAYYLLDEKVVDGLNISLNEVNYTKAILAENLSTLNSLRGDFSKMQNWYTIETFYTDMWPSLNAVSSAEWQSFYYQQLKITQALSKAKLGLKKARQSFNYILEYFFTLSLADIYNRLGKANEAMTYYRKCLIFHKRIGRSYDQITFFALQMALIKLSVKSKQYGEALQLIEELDHTPVETSLYESMEILEQAALCHVYMDNVTESEKCINKAIELAVNDGDCNLLFKINLIAGQICQLLKRTEDAKKSYLQAREISKIAADGVTFKPFAPDMATLYLGLLESGKMDTYFLAELIRSLSDGLKKNIDCWWNLRKTLHLISLLTTSEKKDITETPFYKNIFKAASQRVDCLIFYENNSIAYTEI